jgi:hypothetical protein
MKNFKFLLLIVSLFGIWGCSNDEDDIKEVRKYTAPSDEYRLVRILNYNTSTDLDNYSFTDLEYDGNGNLCKESLYDYPATLFTYREYSYENNLLKEKRIFDGAVGNLQLGTYEQYTYENSNLVKEELFLSDGTLRYTTHYEYAGKNLMNTYKVSDDLGIHHQIKYTYNSLNLVVREESYMYNRELEEFTKYYYDDQLRLIKTEIFSADSSVIQTQENKYVGNSTSPSEINFYNSSGMLAFKHQYIYDDLENLTETRIIDGQCTHILEKNKYDGYLLIEHIQYIPSFGYAEWYVTRYEYSKI